jgi:gluconolactonase
MVSAKLDRRAVIVGGLALVASPVIAAGPVPRELASGLFFPEGVCALGSGDLLFVEIGARHLCRLTAGGQLSTVATLGGGPNGCAIGPDGAAYVANDGGLTFRRSSGRNFVSGVPEDYVHGSIQRVDLRTGAASTLYTRAGANSLKGPNDLLFDSWGGIWFTDTGKMRERERDLGGLYWTKSDGSEIREVVFPLNAPNGIALGTDRRTLYVALSDKRQIVAYTLTGPGQIETENGMPRQRLFSAPAGGFSIDNIAVEESGAIVAAAVGYGGLVTIGPDGEVKSTMKLDDPIVTAMAFGGPDRKTLYVTLSSTGRIVAIDWPRPGLTSTFGGRA